MSNKYITITTKTLSMNMDSGKMQVTANALDTLKMIGCIYGLYSPYEDKRGYRVVHQETPSPALVLQEDISLHGSPFWEPIKVLTEDCQQIEAYLQFRHLLRSIIQMELKENQSVESAKVEQEKHVSMQIECKSDENEQGQASAKGPQMNL